MRGNSSHFPSLEACPQNRDRAPRAIRVRQESVQVCISSSRPTRGSILRFQKIIHSDAPFATPQPKVPRQTSCGYLRQARSRSREFCSRAAIVGKGRQPPAPLRAYLLRRRRSCHRSCDAGARAASDSLRGAAPKRAFTGTSLAGGPALKRALQLQLKWEKTARCVKFLV